MVVGLAVLFVGFEWQTQDYQASAEQGVADVKAEEEVEITKQDTPPPPPPAAAPVVVADALHVVDDNVKLADVNLMSSEDNQASVQTQTYTAPPAAVHAPAATELQKLEKKSLVTFLYIGKPTQEYVAKMGSETRLQLNDKFAEVSEIQDYIAQEKSSMKEEDQPYMTVSIKADKDTKMGVITDVKQALREAYALKISYSARKAQN